MAETDSPSEVELAEEEERRRRGQPTLDEEIARRWDPERLRKTVARDAGRGERLDLSQRNELGKLHPGHDFSEVRVYRGSLADEVTSRHKADAVTIGNTGMIMLRDTPRAAPGTTSGKALLAHEATHVAQAQRGFQFAHAHEQGEDSEHEREARQVEHQAAAPRKDQHDPHRGAEKEKARRDLILQRVFEMLDEELGIASDRAGAGWE